MRKPLLQVHKSSLDGPGDSMPECVTEFVREIVPTPQNKLSLVQTAVAIFLKSALSKGGGGVEVDTIKKDGVDIRV